MPNIKSAIKRVKVEKKRALENSRVKSAYKTAVKKYEEANTKGEKDADKLLNAAKKSLDIASKKGVISKNAASRKKSRLESKLATKGAAKKATKKTEAKAEEKVEEKAEKKTTAKKTTTKKAETTEKKTTAKKTTTAKTTAKKDEE